MPNRKYEKGRRKEYKIVHEERDQGRIAFRSAGSHSPIDVVSIDILRKTIWLIQSKPDTYSKGQTDKLKEQNKDLNNMFVVVFDVR